MGHDESFGIVPVSNESGEWKIFLIKHRHGRYWGFPKGHAEPKESPIQAATRELKEETNLDLVQLLQEQPLVERYKFVLRQRLVQKQVLYFVAKVAGEPILQKNEISEGCWFSLSEATSKITHSEAKIILSKAIEIINN